MYREHAGIAQIGDVVAVRGQISGKKEPSTKMFMVVKVGKNPVVLNNGRKVRKSTGLLANLWWDIRRSVRGVWSLCSDKSIGAPRINPSSPKPPCDKWTQDRGLVRKHNSRLPPYWSLISIKKIKKPSQVSLDFATPNLQRTDIEDAMIVYRYVGNNLA